jgi:hypothetical protein
MKGAKHVYIAGPTRAAQGQGKGARIHRWAMVAGDVGNVDARQSRLTRKRPLSRVVAPHLVPHRTVATERLEQQLDEARASKHKGSAHL